MKVSYYASNSDLKSHLSGHSEVTQVNEVSTIEDLKDKKYKMDGLIADTSAVSPTELIEIRELFPEAKMLLLLSEDLSAPHQRVCAAYSIDSVSQSSQENIIQFLNKNWFAIEENKFENVISISGTHPQAGSTQVAFSFANSIVTKGFKACVIGLNAYNPGEVAGHDEAQSFDMLYTALANNVATFEQIKQMMVQVNEFDYLVGNRNPLKSATFDVVSVELLVEIVKDHYDLVILDTGATYDNALSLGGLLNSGVHILVGTQQSISYQSFERWQNLVLKDLGYTADQFSLLVNKYAPAASISQKQLDDYLGTTLYGYLPYFPGAEDYELENGAILTYATKEYEKQVSQMVTGILSDTGFAKGYSKPKKKKFGIF